MSATVRVFLLLSCGNADLPQHPVIPPGILLINLGRLRSAVGYRTASRVKTARLRNVPSPLSQSLFSCSSIEYLTASDNDLGALPASLAGLSNLKYLDISKNGERLHSLLGGRIDARVLR